MQISITNFRRIKSAEITAEKITILAGKNGDGKTSVVQAIAAAVSGQIIPIDELKKQDAGQLVHTGTGRAEIIVTTPVGSATVTYPDAKRSSEGAFCEISKTAAGLESFVNLPVAERIKYITDLMGCDPRQEDLEETLCKIGITPEVIARIWHTCKAQGWDAAHKSAKESGSKLKGGWEEVTGERYGSDKAASWLPKTWETDLQDITEAELQTNIQNEKGWLEAAISNAAVSNDEIARLTKASDALPGLQKTEADLKSQLDALDTNEIDLAKALRELPTATQPATVPCPHCGGHVIITGNKLSKPSTLSPDEIQARAESLQEANAALQRVKIEIPRVNTELGLTKAKLNAATAAQLKLAQIKTAPADTATNVDDCRTRLKHAEERLAACQAYRNAAKKHDTIQKNQKIIDILAPDGLRLQMLKTATTEINKRLSEISQVTGWQAVKIHDDMSVSYGEYPYILVSKSTQFRAVVSMQMVFAALDGSVMVLIDGADILDTAGRNGLFKMLAWYHGRAIVAMTIILKKDQSPADAVPPVDKIGGCCYWLENGTATKVK